MLKVNDNRSADEENVHIHITMNERQAAQPVKMHLASAQVMDTGRLSINFLQQDSYDVSARRETVDRHASEEMRPTENIIVE
ncbi:hypothetical protein THAR02_05689 [Trichoderma harzianum]|uniref:Uncharacterized protein n=1 Tax=Trichoderma harzianum TaxID=5544 RepID=A0A0F9ZPM2_TRIHA|nr:hypothetical protein THAR02_05689 [Trichoderma harzianum]